jgi:hypothetical protein
MIFLTEKGNRAASNAMGSSESNRSGQNSKRSILFRSGLTVTAAVMASCSFHLPTFAQAPAIALPGAVEQQVMPGSTPSGSTSPAAPLPTAIPQPSPSPLSFLDISNGGFGKVDLLIDDAHLQNSSIDKLHIVASNLDMRAGTVKGLTITVNGGRFPMFVFDQLILNSAADMAFDPVAMKNDKVLQFKSPIEAEVSAVNRI